MPSTFFSSADFTGANLTCATGNGNWSSTLVFANATMHRFQFGGNWDPDVPTGGLVLTGADLSEARIDGNWLSSCASDADYSNANMRGMYFDGNWCGDNKFDGADLTGAYINANWGGDSTFVGAKLVGAYFDGNWQPGTDATGAGPDAGPLGGNFIDYTNADLTDLQVCGNWLGAELVDATVTGLSCQGISFGCRGGTTGTSAACPLATLPSCP